MANETFGPESQRAEARDQFVGNEAGSDEYGERWPFKGFGFIATAMEMLEDTDDARRELLVEQVKTWTEAMGLGRYEGADEAGPMLETIFDILWENGQHPYHGNDRQGYVDQCEGMADTDEDEARLIADFAPFVAIGEAQHRAFEDRVLEDAKRIQESRAAQ